MESLKDNENKSEEKNIDKSLLKKSSNTIVIEELDDNSVLQSVVKKSLKPELIDDSLNSNKIENHNMRLASSRLSDRPKSSRFNSEKAKVSNSLKSNQIEQNITRQPTNLLKEIASREVSRKMANGAELKLGDFLTLDVNDANISKNNLDSRPSTASVLEVVKLSNKCKAFNFSFLIYFSFINNIRK